MAPGPWDLHVGTGETVAVVGGAGSGKTGLARLLSGLVPATAGRIRFLDHDITGHDPAAIVQAGLIHVPQGGRVFPNLSVRDNLLLGATLRARQARQTTLARVLELIPVLRATLERRAQLLPPGEQRVLAIGRGLMALPRLLLLDAPDHALSPECAGLVLALVSRLQDRALSILLTAQPGSAVGALANRCYAVEHGRQHSPGV